MEIEILVAVSELEAGDVVFDSRDLLDAPISRVDLEDEIEAALDLGNTSVEQNSLFALLEPLKNFSIADLFTMIVKKAKDKGVEKLVFLAGTEAIREYLLEKVPPVEHLISEYQFHGQRFLLMTGNITEISADAIVNASNTRLVLGAGVSGAIREQAGPGLQAEMHAIAKTHNLLPGDVVITGAHNLKDCRFILHAATASGSVHAVSQAVSRSLDICRKRKINSVAFPALGTGTGALDISECARLIIGEVVSFWKTKGKGANPSLVIVVLYGKHAYKSFEESAKEFFGEKGIPLNERDS
jgi:O-acetyl-ADP-ribose deacetylase